MLHLHFNSLFFFSFSLYIEKKMCLFWFGFVDDLLLLLLIRELLFLVVLLLYVPQISSNYNQSNPFLIFLLLLLLLCVILLLLRFWGWFGREVNKFQDINKNNKKTRIEKNIFLQISYFCCWKTIFWYLKKQRFPSFFSLFFFSFFIIILFEKKLIIIIIINQREVIY